MNASTYPEHDCKAWNTQCFHNQDDAQYTTCGICNRITNFKWKADGQAITAANQDDCGCGMGSSCHANMSTSECQHEYITKGIRDPQAVCRKCGIEPNANKKFSGLSTETPHIKGDFSEPIVGGHFESNESPNEQLDSKDSSENARSPQGNKDYCMGWWAGIEAYKNSIAQKEENMCEHEYMEMYDKSKFSSAVNSKKCIKCGNIQPAQKREISIEALERIIGSYIQWSAISDMHSIHSKHVHELAQRIKREIERTGEK